MVVKGGPGDVVGGVTRRTKVRKENLRYELCRRSP